MTVIHPNPDTILLLGRTRSGWNFGRLDFGYVKPLVGWTLGRLDLGSVGPGFGWELGLLDLGSVGPWSV